MAKWTSWLVGSYRPGKQKPLSFYDSLWDTIIVINFILALKIPESAPLSFYDS